MYTISFIKSKLNNLKINSYPERWRDWPYEARQPVVTTVVPIPAELRNQVLIDKGGEIIIPSCSEGFLLSFLNNNLSFFRRITKELSA
jgi:hypothetical protein